jgi:DNA polymerase III epsilon subunit-like protein
LTSALESVLVEVLKDLGAPAHTTQILRRFREKGVRPISEELLARECRKSPRLREVSTGKFALLSELAEEAIGPSVDSSEEVPDAGLALGDLAAIRCRTYVAFDLETTGIDPVEDAIIQIAAVRVEGGRVTGVFFEPVHP